MRRHRTVQAALVVLASATDGLVLVGRSIAQPLNSVPLYREMLLERAKRPAGGRPVRRRGGGGFVVAQIAFAGFG